MQKNYKFFLVIVFVGFALFNGNVFSQGDNCGEAVDISAAFNDAFASPCNYIVDGPYTNQGATIDADAAEFDEAWESVTGSMSCCACESENSGDPDVNNPVWFEFTPANTGDYSLWALGDESSQNGCSAEFAVQGDDDTQFWIFTGECGDLTLYDCNEDASNALFFEAGAVFNFTAGTKYYLVVDGYLGSQGEFCIEVALDTGDCVNCGDDICGLGFGETYCDCDSECPCDLLNGLFIQRTDAGAFNFTILGTAEVAFCADYLSSLLGAAVEPNFTYLGFGFVDVIDLDGDEVAGDCANNPIDSVTVTYDIGTLTNGVNVDYPSGSDNIPTGSLLFFKLTDDDIANNDGITLNICTPNNGNGNECCVPKFITFSPALTPGVTDPSCPCAAGSIPLAEVTACVDGTIDLMTNGDERLDIDCPSDDGSGFVYAWRVLADVYGAGDFQSVSGWQPYGSDATVNVNDFFIDNVGVFPPNFTAGAPIPITNYYSGEPTPLIIQGGAVCFNSNGNVAEGCFGITENEEGNFIDVTYLPAGDAGCDAGGNCTQSINLNPGWNLISLDVTPADTKMGTVFQSIIDAGNLEFITGFDAAAITFNPFGPPFLNTLKDVADGFGYWVKVTSADVLTVEGACIDDAFRKPFDAGWNLVAFPPDDQEAPQDYFAGLIGSNDLEFVTGFENGTLTYDPEKPPFLNTLKFMKNGFGYWVKVVNPSAKTANNLTNVFSFINGTSNLPYGEQVQILSEAGEVVAILDVIQDNYLMTTPVYGDDATTTFKENINIGETLRFSWDNQISDFSTAFKGDYGTEKIELEFKLENLTNSFEVKAYPVPAKEELNFEFILKEQNNLLLKIYDNKGSLVESIDKASLAAGKQIINYNVEHLAEGIYTYQFILDKQLKSGKFNVVR